MPQKFPLDTALFLEQQRALSPVLYSKLPNLPQDLPNYECSSPSDIAEISYAEFWSLQPDIHLATVKHSSVLTSPSSKKTKIFMKLHCDKISLQPGDSFCLVPPNNENEVELLKSKYSSQTTSIIHNNKQYLLIDFIRFFLNLRAFPKKSHIKYLADQCEHFPSKEYLCFISSPEGSTEYNRLRQCGCTILDFLLEFSFTSPLSELIRIIPPIQGRFYSIANSQLSQPDTIDFCFTVVKEPNNGLCTEWLSNLAIESQLALTLNGSNGKLKMQSFRLPTDFHNFPLVMVAAGTGIAPFIGFLNHFKLLNQRPKKTILFFGCRNEQQDFLFQSELERFKDENILDEYFVAFSEDDDLSKRCYVQQKITLSAQLLTQLLVEQEGFVYVCGNGAQMAKDVMHLFEQTLSIPNSKEFIAQMLVTKRYCQDIW